MAESESAYAVEMRGIVKRFPGVVALDHVNFRVRRGEIHGLVGKNGAGKSTLMHVLTGLYQADEGEIRIGGESIAPITPERARNAGVAIVPQHAQLIPGLSIAENIFAGRPPTSRVGFVDWKRMFREAAERLAQFDVYLDVTRLVEGLSVAERQTIDIARALFADASVIILDEPTAPLPKDDVDLLFDFVRRQRARGVSFIYISHYLEEVFRLCDRVTILRDGSVVGDYPVNELDQATLVRLISGQNVGRFGRERQEGRIGPPVLVIDGLSSPGRYENVHLTLHAGEIVGITGLEGSGKSELAHGLFGLDSIGTGRILLDGRPYVVHAPHEALACGLAYLPRDRHGMGIVGPRSVQENISLAVLRRILGFLGFLRAADEAALARHYIDALGIVVSSPNQPIESLSGGNQQKAVVAKLAATRPKVLLLDEPTQGVDVQAKVEIFRIIDDLARHGVAVAVISDEVNELLDICDRIVVMYRGMISAEFAVGEAETTPERVLLAIEGEARVV